MLSVVTMLSEGILLVVAAQAGFIDGPRVLANMAVDSWVPRRFAALSDRLTTHNGIVLMGATSLAALLYTHGDVGTLVVMYSINVFLTFSLSMFGMLRQTLDDAPRGAALAPQDLAVRRRLRALRDDPGHHRDGEVQARAAGSPCSCTGAVIGLCFVIRGHYRRVRFKLAQLYQDVEHIGAVAPTWRPSRSPTARAPTAAVLVPNFGGIGIHTILNVFRAFPSHFKNLVFISVGVIDSGGFKGAEAVESLEADTEAMLKRYCAAGDRLGVPSDVPVRGRHRRGGGGREALPALIRDFPIVTFFAGKVMFEQERWYQRFLHNETALSIQKRLYWAARRWWFCPRA